MAEAYTADTADDAFTPDTVQDVQSPESPGTPGPDANYDGEDGMQDDVYDELADTVDPDEPVDSDGQYLADALEPVDYDVDIADEYAERMEQYDLDPEDGWTPLLEAEGYDELEEVLDLEGAIGEELEDVYTDAVDDTQYAEASDEPVAAEDLEVYGRLLEDDEGSSYLDIAVVKQDMPDNLAGFTFTDPTSDKAVFVNQNLYAVDDPDDQRTSTTFHEIAHKLNPGKDEKTVRYIAGTPDSTLAWEQDLGDVEAHRYQMQHQREQDQPMAPMNAETYTQTLYN